MSFSQTIKHTLQGVLLYPRQHINTVIGQPLAHIPLHSRSFTHIKKLTFMAKKELGIYIKPSTIGKKINESLDFYNQHYQQKDKVDAKTLEHKIKRSMELSTVNTVTEAYVQDLKESLAGQICIWLPSDADDPDPSHERNYFKEFDCTQGLDGDFPGERYGCQCGVQVK